MLNFTRFTKIPTVTDANCETEAEKLCSEREVENRLKTGKRKELKLRQDLHVLARSPEDALAHASGQLHGSVSTCFVSAPSDEHYTVRWQAVEVKSRTGVASCSDPNRQVEEPTQFNKLEQKPLRKSRRDEILEVDGSFQKISKLCC